MGRRTVEASETHGASLDDAPREPWDESMRGNIAKRTEQPPADARASARASARGCERACAACGSSVRTATRARRRARWMTTMAHEALDD